MWKDNLVYLNETTYFVCGVGYTLIEYINEFGEPPTRYVEKVREGAAFRKYVADYDQLPKSIKKYFDSKEDFEECRKNTKYLYVCYLHWNYLFSNDDPFISQYSQGIFRRKRK